MNENLEAAMESIERGIREAVPIVDPTILAEETWTELAEAVAEGWFTREDAEEMFFQWFNHHS